MLLDAGVLVSHIRSLEGDTYRAATYISQSLHHGTRTSCLLDRNIVSRLVGLVRGAQVTPNHRLAAAVMAFLQVIEAAIEPNMALYELASKQGSDTANGELVDFYRLLQTHPQAFADVALGRGPLDLGSVPDEAPPIAAVDFESWLRRWEGTYIAILKVALLELTDACPETKFSSLMDWMANDFIFSAPTMVLASHYLAPNTNRKRALKGLRSRDPVKRFDGIRNAAWDLTLIAEWIARVEKETSENVMWLLASADKLLCSVALRIFVPSTSQEEVDSCLLRELTSTWGTAAGRRLFDRYKAHESKILAEKGVRTIRADAGRAIMAKLEDGIRNRKAT